MVSRPPLKLRTPLIAAASCTMLTASAASQTRPAMSPCTVAGVTGPTLCGKIAVPERRENPEGKRIELNVVILKATDSAAVADPLVFLAGGGVLPATRFAPFLGRTMAEVRRSRDILLVDQRGTGGSNPLHCSLELPSPRDSNPDTVIIRQRVAACVSELATRADLGAYTTTRAMHDLEYVRSALGYGPLNLWGLSYGTKAAREYLRLYPAQVRSIVLYGVVPRAHAWWHEQGTNAEAVLREYYGVCAREESCRSAFPNGRADIDELLSRLERQPLRVNDSTAVSASDVRRALYNRMGESWSAVTIPLLVKLALAGDVTAFVPPPRQSGSPPIPRGIFYNLTCSEEFPRISLDLIRSSGQGTFVGPSSVLQHQAVCRNWPTAPIESGLWQEVRSTVPALIMNGALDHITPPRYARALTATLPRSRLLIVPSRGHNDFDPCLGQIIQQFVLRPDPERVDTACLGQTPPLRFPTSKAELPSR
jgi:pimeloyl-ACP methyl ester carboxylesterase